MADASSSSRNDVRVPDSEFAMWRAIFAFAYVDNVLSLEEQDLLHSYLAKVPFSNAQRIILKEDLRDPKDVLGLYRKITNPDDKKRFCVMARAIAWCEGDVDEQEKSILKKVSCFGESAEEEILKGTANHPDVEALYKQYAKAGMMGMFPQPHMVELRV